MEKVYNYSRLDLNMMVIGSMINLMVKASYFWMMGQHLKVNLDQVRNMATEYKNGRMVPIIRGIGKIMNSMGAVSFVGQLITGT